MKVKKTQRAAFHLGNRLNGTKPKATYGVFNGETQVGFVVDGSIGGWDAYAMNGKSRLNGYTCSTLAQLKAVLAAK